MLEVSLDIGRSLKGFENVLRTLGQDGPKAEARAVNRVGDMAKTQVVRALAKQTGLPVKTTRRAVENSKRADWSDPTYVLSGTGGDIALKYFRARETRKGVTAFPRGQRKLFERTFIKGGSFVGGRVRLNMGGQVFQRLGGRLPIEKQKSGITIPGEMMEGETVRAFEDTVERHLPRRLDHEIGRLLGL